MAVSTLPAQNPFRTGHSPNMRLESERLNSFEGWSCPFMSPLNLAQAGFYYTKKQDVVKCAYCSVEIGNWAPGDDAVADHTRWSPNCAFLNNSGEDTCGRYDIRPNSIPEGEGHDLVVSNRMPAYPDYAIYDARLRSFNDWPKGMKQSPAEMADAGFFYTGNSDRTLCFHCGGGLNNWEDNDVPWEQHAIWFPKCKFLLLKKTREFVEAIVRRMNEAAFPTTETKDEQKTPVSETKEENSNSAFLCKICYNKNDGALFLPCGHIFACVDCALACQKCPICRIPLESVVRVFL